MKNALKRGDVVVVIAGNSKGKVGKITEVLREKNRVVVEGVAVAKRHIRKSQKYPNGAIVEKFMPIHASNVMLQEVASERARKKNKNA
jgi:large subunit ribosomal protein L24